MDEKKEKERFDSDIDPDGWYYKDGTLTPEGIQGALLKAEGRIEVLEDELTNRVDNLETDLDNLYHFCREAGIKMPRPVTAVEALRKLKG